MNPYVFIVGSPRSGTTLLARMLDAHRQIAVLHELQWLARYFEKRKGLTADGLVTPKLIQKLLENQRFVRLQIERDVMERLISNGGMTYSTFVSALFDLYGSSKHKSMVGEKNPAYARSIETLHSLWPSARFVHVIRDGRDVCLSILNWDKAHRAAGRFARAWSRDPVATSALFWEWNVRLARDAGAALGPGLYRELRYEALVADPAAESAELCAFLELPSDSVMLRYDEGRSQPNPVLEGRHVWRPVTPGMRDWRTQMSRDQLERFEAEAGDLLDELGYPRGTRDPSGQALDEAAAVRELFSTEVLARKGRLPEQWAT